MYVIDRRFLYYSTHRRPLTVFHRRKIFETSSACLRSLIIFYWDFWAPSNGFCGQKMFQRSFIDKTSIKFFNLKKTLIFKQKTLDRSFEGNWALKGLLYKRFFFCERPSTKRKSFTWDSSGEKISWEDRSSLMGFL